MPTLTLPTFYSIHLQNLQLEIPRQRLQTFKIPSIHVAILFIVESQASKRPKNRETLWDVSLFEARSLQERAVGDDV